MFLLLFFSFLLIGAYYISVSVKKRFDLSMPRFYLILSLNLLILTLNIITIALFKNYSIDLRSLPMKFIFYGAYTSFTVFIFTFIFSLIFDIFSYLKKKTFKKAPNPERRNFLKKTAQTSFLTGVIGTSAIGTAQAKGGPKFKYVSVPTQDPAVLGLKIIQISDLHVGPTVARNYVQKVVDMSNSQNPDIVVITGDIVDGSPEQLLYDMEPLKELKSQLGVYGCLGNHELYSGVYEWLPQFEELNIQMLNNESVLIESQKHSLALAGVPDPYLGKAYKEFEPDTFKAISGIAPDTYKILLAHQPIACHQALEAGIDLQLSGHTHAGQFFPFNFIVRFFHPYIQGLNRHKKGDKSMWVYVNTATGYWGPINRFLIPPEITVLTFEKS